MLNIRILTESWKAQQHNIVSWAAGLGWLTLCAAGGAVLLGLGVAKSPSIANALIPTFVIFWVFIFFVGR